MSNKVLYLIGSLRNERVSELAKTIRSNHPDFEVFDDWYAAGPEADDYWKAYEQARGSSYQEALKGHAARNVFAFDKRNLDRASHALLVLPAGKSGHMEIMYATYGVRAKTAILLDPEDVRWDVMYQFVPTVLNNDEEINDWLNPKPQYIGEYYGEPITAADWSEIRQREAKDGLVVLASSKRSGIGSWLRG